MLKEIFQKDLITSWIGTLFTGSAYTASTELYAEQPHTVDSLKTNIIVNTGSPILYDISLYFTIVAAGLTIFYTIFKIVKLIKNKSKKDE